MKLLLTSFIFTLFLSGCASYPVPRYSISAHNVQAFKALSKKIHVSSFTWSAKGTHDNFQCRAAGPIETSEKIKFEDYIKKAIEDEILLAEALSPKGTPLSIAFNEMDVSTTSSVWTISSNVTFGNRTFTHVSKTQFEGGFIADNACRNAANSFIAAVQDYTKALIPKLSSTENSKISSAH